MVSGVKRIGEVKKPKVMIPRYGGGARRVSVSPSGGVSVSYPGGITEEQIERVKSQQVAAEKEATQIEAAKQKTEEKAYIKRYGMDRKAEVRSDRLIIPTEKRVIEIRGTREEPKRTYTARDISFIQSFFPTKGTREERGLVTKENQKEGKILFQEYADIKITQAIKRISEPVDSFIKESPYLGKGTKQFLTEEKYQFSPTQLGKFVLFGPAFTSTQTALQNAIRRGEIVPTTETRFIADVTKRGKSATVKVAGETRVKGVRVGTLSKQIIKDLDDVTSIGRGRTLVGLRTFEGKQFGVTDFMSVSKKLGTTKQVKSILGTAKIEKTLGKGVAGRSYGADIFRIRTAKVPIRGEVFYQPRVPDFAVRLPDTLKVNLRKTEVVGVIKSVNQRLSQFAGTTAKPVRVLTKEGIKLRVPTSAINIKGIVRTTIKETTPTGSQIFKTGITKTPLQKTFQKQTENIVQQSIASQLATTVDAAKRLAISTVKTKRKFIPLTKPPTVTKQKTKKLKADVIPRGRFETDLGSQKFENLGVLTSRLGQTPATISRSASTPKLKTKVITKQKPVEKLVSSVVPRLRTEQRQQLKQKTKVRQIQRSKFRTTPIITSFSIRPRIPKVPLFPLFSFKVREVKRPTSRRRIPKEDIGISEGFTARVLELKPVTILKTNIQKISEIPTASLGIRRTPIIR